MKNSYLLLIMAITLVYGLEESLTLMSLEQMNSLDTSQFDCSRPQSEFIQMENSLSQWQDLMEHKDYIDHDIQVLQGIQAKVGLKASHKQVIKSLSQLKLPKTSTKIGLAEVEALKQQCGCLKNSDDNCDALLKLLSYFILSLRNVQSQCQQHPITVIKIKGKIHDLQVIRAGCGGTIDIKGDEGCDTKEQTESTTKPTDVPATDPIVQPTTDPVPDDQKDSEEPVEETITEETVDTTEEEQADQLPPVDTEETTQPEEGEVEADEKQPEEGSPDAEETEPTVEEEQEGSPEETEAEEGVDAPVEEEEADVQAEEEGTDEQTQSAEEGESTQEEVDQPEEITEPEEEIEIQVPEEGSEENVPESAEEEQASNAEEGQPESTEEGQAETAEEGQAESTEEGQAESAEEGQDESAEEGQAETAEEGVAEEGVVEAPEETVTSAEEEELQIDEPAEEVDIEVPAEEEACEEEELVQEEESFDEEVAEEGSEQEGDQVAGESEEEQSGGEQEGEESSQQPDAEETESSVGEPLEFEEEQNDEVPADEETTADEETPVDEETTSDEETTTFEETTDEEEGSVGDEPVPDDQQDEEQEVLPEGCRQVPEDVLDISWLSTESIVVSDLPVTESQIIGLSFYFRWLSKFPEAVPEGLNQETKFFVAGLGNALKFYVGQGGFHFSSFDENGVETYKNAGHGDIEGQWVLIYFGISNQKVTGFAQIQGQDVETIEFDVNLTLDESYQLVIGGPDGDVKSFNGQIARVFAFNDELYTETSEFTQFITNCYGIPKNIYSGKRLTIPIEKERTFVSPAAFDYDSIFENKKPMLPDEYSASGWFKWEAPNDQNIWHSGFRWTTNNQETNQNFRLLGDRGLSFFVGDEENLQGHVAFCTYSYKTSNGKSKVNDCKMVKYGNKLTEWFYVYFGYSRHLNKAYGYMEFTHEMAQMEFKDVRHYYASKIYFYLGQDKFYPPFNGKVQGFMLNFFDGSYRTSSYDYTFGYFPRPVYEYDDSKELIPSEPVQKKKCPKVVEITVDNASDVLCALSSYLSAVAQGHDPASDPKAETFCFCLVYEEENASPDLLMLAQIFGGKIKQKSSNVNSSIKKLINRQNALLK